MAQDEGPRTALHSAHRVLDFKRKAALRIEMLNGVQTDCCVLLYYQTLPSIRTCNEMRGITLLVLFRANSRSPLQKNCYFLRDTLAFLEGEPRLVARGWRLVKSKGAVPRC